jgi:hypothetical protein
MGSRLLVSWAPIFSKIGPRYRAPALGRVVTNVRFITRKFTACRWKMSVGYGKIAVLTKGKLMSNVSTALALASACKEAVYDNEVREGAMEMFIELGIYPSEETIKALFKYSALLTANTATRITSVLMPVSEFNSMMSEVNEMEKLMGGLE